MYNYATWRGLTLPKNLVVDQSPAPAELVYSSTTAGGFDNLFGEEAARIYPYEVVIRGYFIYDTVTNFRLGIENWRTHIGKRGQLKRIAINDTDEAQAADARLKSFNYTSNHFNRLHVAVEITLSVETLFYGFGYSDWFSRTQLFTLDAGNTYLGSNIESTFSSGSTTLSFANNGYRPITDCVIRIDVGATETLGDLRIYNSVENFSIEVADQGGVGDGDYFAFDCGAKKLVHWDGSSLNDITPQVTLTDPSHTIGPWVLLPFTGSGSVYCTADGLDSNSTFQLSFVEQWA